MKSNIHSPLSSSQLLREICILSCWYLILSVCGKSKWAILFPSHLLRGIFTVVILQCVFTGCVLLLVSWHWNVKAVRLIGRPYLHAHVCIMHVHACAQVLVGAFAQEVFDKLVGILEVVSTASPLPRLAVLQVRGLVTRAALHASRAASFRHSVGEARWGDGIQEGCLFKSCRSYGGRWDDRKWRYMTMQVIQMTLQPARTSL